MKQHFIASAPILCVLATLFVTGAMISLLIPEGWENAKFFAFTASVFLSAWVGWRVNLKLKQ